jgi:hypothetical protein
MSGSRLPKFISTQVPVLSDLLRAMAGFTNSAQDAASERLARLEKEYGGCGSREFVVRGYFRRGALFVHILSKARRFGIAWNMEKPLVRVGDSHTVRGRHSRCSSPTLVNCYKREHHHEGENPGFNTEQCLKYLPALSS